MSRDHDTEFEQFEEEIRLDDALDQLCIFDGINAPSNTFNAITISLDGKNSSTFNWKSQFERALALSNQGFSIIFELILDWQQPFEIFHEAKFQAMLFACRHFVQTLAEYTFHTAVGLLLFRGSLSFSSWIKPHPQLLENYTHWQKIHSVQDTFFYNELFLRDQFFQYLNTMTQYVPEWVGKIALFKNDVHFSPFEFVQLVAKDATNPFILAISDAPCITQSLVWENGKGFGYIGRKAPVSQVNPRIGFILPNYTACIAQTNNSLCTTFHFLFTQNILFKVISEEYIMLEWTELDFLIAATNTLTFEGKRKIEGFCAAGGTFIYTDIPLNVEHELSFEQWQKSI